MRALGFGLFFFGAHPGPAAARYDAILDLAAAADRAGLSFVSVPERHFHAFGGAFPAPAVVGAALAVRTDRIQLRAGSVITPLHDVVRVAEDWSVVDNLSKGRVGLSLGSGWSANDFVLAPDARRYERRRELVREHVTVLRALWRGEEAERTNAAGRPFAFSTFPRPVQAELPLWLTAGGGEETFAAAGRLGTNVLTHLERQPLDVLASRIGTYRAERERAGLDPAGGRVTLMQHTLIGDDAAATRDAARAHLGRYIASSIDLENRTVTGGGRTSGGSPVMPFRSQADADYDAVVTAAVERYIGEAGLIGGVDECRQRAARYLEAGVDEIACLVDFVEDDDLVRRGIAGIAALAATLSPEAADAHAARMIEQFNR